MVLGMKDFPLDVLFIDGEAIVINKPAGLAVHPGPKTPESLEDRLDDLRFGFARRPQPVHRLDRDTSGCLLLSRNPKAHKRFAAAFEAGQVAKTYMAILDGVPAARDGLIIAALSKISSPEGGWRVVLDPDGQRAVTRWRMVGEADGRALIAFKPQTGRTHQLRVHAAAALGVPILGDPIYGRGGEGGTKLHALWLQVPRASKPPVDALAPLPHTFAELGFGDAVRDSRAGRE